MKASKYIEELRSQTPADLNDKLTEAKKELFNLRFQNATNQLENTGRIREVRRNIARNSLRNTSLRIFRDFTKVGGML